MHRISSRNSTLSVSIKVYLLSPLASSPNEVSFTAGASHWTTGSFAKSITLSQNGPSIYDMTLLSMIAISGAT